MQNVKRSSILFAVAGFAIAAILIALAPRADAQPSSIAVQTTAAATSSWAYLLNGSATSTYQIDSYPSYSSSKAFSMAGIDAEYLYLELTASSTATVYSVTPQFSNNGIDWYNYSNTTVAGSQTLASTTAYAFDPNTTATTFVSFKLPDMSGLHERLVFSASGAAGAIYAEVVNKKSASGQ